jgi:gliding motility-associated lipoprotein GldH
LKSVHPIISIIIVSLGLQVALKSCTTVDLYEKTVAIPAHEWSGAYKPGFTFNITDTSSQYELFIILRHTERYHFNNLFFNLHIQAPGGDSSLVIQKDLILGDNINGWRGVGMDDIYDHRISLGLFQGLLGLNHSIKSGTYTFSLEQLMREDPLENILNAGIRIEKKK